MSPGNTKWIVDSTATSAIGNHPGPADKSSGKNTCSAPAIIIASNPGHTGSAGVFALNGGKWRDIRLQHSALAREPRSPHKRQTTYLLQSLLTLALLAQAQSPGPDLIRRAEQLLSSPTPADRAWGAALAGGICGPNMESLLTQQLQALPADGSPADSYHVELALLDATLRCQFHPPASAFWHLRHTWPTHTIALLAANARTNESLLLQLRSQSLSWHDSTAVSEILRAIPSTQLFIETLQKTHFTQHITVVSTGKESSAPAPKGFGSVAADFVSAHRPAGKASQSGYPQPFTYQWFPLAAPAQESSHLQLATLKLLRVPVGEAKKEEPINRTSQSDLQGYPPNALLWNSTLVWTSEAQFETRLKAALNAQAETVRELAHAFTRRSRQLLPMQSLAIEVTFTDQRQPKRNAKLPPLPTPGSFPFPVVSYP